MTCMMRREEPKYFVKAEFLHWGIRSTYTTKSGREVGMVKQRLLTLLPAFDIEIDGKEFRKCAERVYLL